jgi:hypothetical protein
MLSKIIYDPRKLVLLSQPSKEAELFSEWVFSRVVLLRFYSYTSDSRSDWRAPSAFPGKDMSNREMITLPKVGTVVRSRITFRRIRKGASARVKGIAPGNDGSSISLETVLRGEISISAWEYSRFFEVCDVQDAAWEYWASGETGDDYARPDLRIRAGHTADVIPHNPVLRFFASLFRRGACVRKMSDAGS